MKYMTHPKLRPLLADLFGEEPFACQSMFYFKPPGARGQDLHQDNFYLRVKPGTCLAAWVAIDDADEDNGGMMCVPNTATLAIACPEKSDPTKYLHHRACRAAAGPEAGARPSQGRRRAVLQRQRDPRQLRPTPAGDRFRRSFICHYVPASTTEMSRLLRGLQFCRRAPGRRRQQRRRPLRHTSGPADGAALIRARATA